ncbi:hypothetical protein MPTK1_2g15975 [Marchantia polymorpha subsp. ruderalis]|uniref:Uncharacterized protein n=1 Tax=Marchantia polymorpha TaxID=3197 RepID=A0A2R6WK86_MARPO|nr:hypothetical protein MARPO_0082s0090 [Marchantia polymorpha]BBN02520.1 hypothetical protein Mp_2g15950 [Marchantia polymorpha subsp. ruderalis]|eukprot:PTQ34268.1 hypothetical protein MARPO_0082s0090 [Marchantia polymorpha]
MESAKNTTNPRAKGSASDVPAAVELQYPGSLYKIPGSLGERHSIDLESDQIPPPKRPSQSEERPEHDERAQALQGNGRAWRGLVPVSNIFVKLKEDLFHEPK